PPGPSIHAITFDAGGTLMECWPSVGHIYSEVAARNGFRDVPVAALNRRFALAWRRFKAFRHTREQWAMLVDATFGELVQPPPSVTFFPALYERFTRAASWHVFDDVVPTLQSLRARGLKLGVISNWDDRLRPLLRALRLDRSFDVITISCEVGSPKPRAEIFCEAARALALPPATILHVGDSRESDFRGARAAGLQALLLKRGGGRVRPGEIRSLRALV
ncbi:MAG TPA: HAD-IA family hydrolase, partial [Verrucomicrobiae bacterium]